ncbi:MAG: hypothetical protein ACLFV2_02550 [Desulfurivibrionaceae bacterium]
MRQKKISQKASRLAVSDIALGFDRERDELSLAAFLLRFTSPTVLDTIIPRLKDEEINATLDFLTGLIRRHLEEEEYHSLFLDE